MTGVATEPFLVLTTWGLDLSDPNQWEATLQRVKNEGYSAVEGVPTFCYAADPKRFRQVLQKIGLQLIVQVHTDGGYMDPETGAYVYVKSCVVDRHLASFAKQLHEAVEMQPLHVNVHAGHDSWDHEQSVEFMLKAQEIVVQAGMEGKVSFETHRARLMYSPYTTRRLLQDPRIRGKIALTADLSHWCCVCHVIFDENEERDACWWPETLELVAEHTLLVHHRVGHEQGPQVTDPRDPSHSFAVQSHVKWWKTIWAKQRERGLTVHLSEMEFGPAPYLQTLPFTHQPVVSQWEVNNVMRDMVKEAFLQAK